MSLLWRLLSHDQHLPVLRLLLLLSLLMPVHDRLLLLLLRLLSRSRLRGSNHLGGWILLLLLLPVYWSLLTDRLPDHMIRRHVGHHLVLIHGHELLLCLLLWMLVSEHYPLRCPVHVRDDVLLANHLLASDRSHPDSDLWHSLNLHPGDPGGDVLLYWVSLLLLLLLLHLWRHLLRMADLLCAQSYNLLHLDRAADHLTRSDHSPIWLLLTIVRESLLRRLLLNYHLVLLLDNVLIGTQGVDRRLDSLLQDHLISWLLCHLSRLLLLLLLRWLLLLLLLLLSLRLLLVLAGDVTALLAADLNELHPLLVRTDLRLLMR